MHLTHPPQTMSFFHLPTSSAPAFDVGYPGVWGIQSWGKKQSRSALFLLGIVLPLIPVASLGLSQPCSLAFNRSLHTSPTFQPSFSANIHYKQLFSSSEMKVIIPWAAHVILCSCSNSYTSITTRTRYLSPTVRSAHFIKEPFRMLLQPLVKWTAGYIWC